MLNKFATPEDTLNECDILPGNLLEFGVYNGNTMARLVKSKLLDNRYWKDHNFKEVWGFDSFEGLPADAYKDGNPDWKEGSFNVVKDDGFISVESAEDFIRKRVDHPNMHLVKGWFKDTLIPGLGINLCGSASYIHIDCDIFSSTKDCLDWLFNWQVPLVGCVFRYDDWTSTPLYQAGESLAHKLMEQKYNLTFTQTHQNVFVLDSY